MTIDKDIDKSLDLDNLSFGQSMLANSNADQNLSPDPFSNDINLRDSFLLGNITGNNKNIESSKGNIRTCDYIEEDVGNDICDLNMKSVKLFDGSIVTLKPKNKKISNIDITSIEMEATDSIVNMDELFNRINTRKSLRKNHKRSKHKDQPQNTSQPCQIWAEKYRPSKFVDLCSAGNDRQYRLILHWLKKWSPLVFKEEYVSNDNVDSFGRPHKKFLLINGPLGIGKTACALILARQMGYSVQELNASNSMDSLPHASSTTGSTYNNATTALKLKIMNALTSNSLTSNGKPTCLVIDEIDSSINSHEIVKVLNDLAYSDLRALYKTFKKDKSSMESALGELKNKNSRKAKAFMLNRPIICIANDIYSTGNSSRNFGASSMDKLRPLCDIVTLRKPSTVKLNSGLKASGNASRSIKEHLMRINERESIGMDYQQIGDVVEVCESDIRACLNYLQFNGRKIDLPTVSPNVPEGNRLNKDTQMSWFAMVDILFKRDSQLSKDENFIALMDIVMNGSGKSAISSSGTLDKVIRGCFNKYLDVVHRQDDSLHKPSVLSDWLSFYDLMSGNNDIETYSSLVSMKIWSLFSELNPNRYPKENSLIPNSKSIEFEAYELLKQNRSVTKRIIDKLPLSLKLSVGGGGDTNDTLACYFLPFLNKLLTPDTSDRKLKSTLKDFERKLIERVAILVKDMDLKLEQQRDIETGQNTLQLSPSWDSITNFDTVFLPIPESTLTKQVQIKRQWLFPLIQSELERLEMIKQSTKRTVGKLDSKNDDDDTENKKKKSRLSSLDFFKGRYDVVASQINEKDTNHELTRIWVKYNEGFSNAVRKNIGWDDIWA